MNALKCDRCGKYYDYDPTAKYNYISFGHKDIIPNKKVHMKDICPECMEKFIYWLENPDGWSPEECKRYLNESIMEEQEQLDNMKLCNREKCKGCEKFGWTIETSLRPNIPGGYYACRMFNRVVTNPCEDKEGAKLITPKMFLESDVIFREKEEELEIPCKTCNDGVCEQCEYGYKSEEEIKEKLRRRNKNNNDD